ncbi:MAG: hypothetical protein DBX55_04215 [Verrucomicrobia bacterium]|nr:MAG: hypothetical protein DBX55_04215 [Verrucomicrobiota bacterium]
MKFLRILSIAAASFLCAAQAARSESARRPADFAAKPAEKPALQSISLYVENDIYFSDRYYTNGLKIMYTGEGDDFLASKLQFMALRALIDGRQAHQTACIGQNMYVPGEISDPNPPSWDRPYAGWLYVGAGAHLASKDRLDSLSVNLGVVGPISLAEDAQKFFHSIIGATWPMGWHDQVKNEPGIEIGYNHSERLLRFGGHRGWASDFIGSIGADLGNVKTQGQLRALARFGYNVPYSFDPNRIDAAGGNDVEWIPEDGRPDWHLYFYGGGAARFVAYDIALDGNTFADSRWVVPKWLVGEVLAGVSARYGRFEADLNYTLRTAEFNHQKHPVHMFWTLRLKVFF